VDEAALVKALRERRIAAAGLDVYENEPRLTPGLAELPNVVLLPHLGSATESTRRRMSEMAANNVIAVLRGETPPNAVN
jgi:glyoxylate reductase